VISLIAFVVGILVLLVFVFKADELVKSGIDSRVFYILLLPLGLSAATFLFGVTGSVAVARGSVRGWKVELRGPVVVFFLVVAVALFYVVPQGPFDVTVFVHGSEGRQHIVLRNEGEVMIDLDGDRRIEKIGDKSDAHFLGIPAKFFKKQVSVSVTAEDIRPVMQNFILNKDKKIYVEVEKLPSPDFDTTVFLHGSRHRHDIVLKNKGTLTVYLGKGYQTEKIGERGEAYFVIPGEFRDQEVSFALDAEGFELVNPSKQYRLADENIHAEIKRTVKIPTTIPQTTTTIPQTTTTIPRITTTVPIHKTKYKVDLIIPSGMVGAKILVDGKPAKIYNKALAIVTIIVEEKNSPHEITIKKGKDLCTATQIIEEDNLQIIPCQDR